MKQNRILFCVISFLILFNILVPVLYAQQPLSGMRQEDKNKKALASEEAIDSRLISANTKFGFNLFEKLLKVEAGKNLFISPASISIALAMAYNGADKETRDAMAKTLEIEGMGQEDLNQANSTLKKMLQNPGPKVELNIANSLWARKGIKFKPDFIKRNEEFYGARVTTLDFKDPKAPSAINEWVSENTKGKIGKIIDKISCTPDCKVILYLINAIYFKGTWSKEFDKNLTKEVDFYLLDGSRKKHPMMSQSGNYMYLEDKGFQAVNLPYGDGRLSMYIFLPEKDSSLEEFYKTLNTEAWNKWMSQFRDMEGSIVFPRFKLEYGVTLNDTLKSLGMEIAFDRDRANFRNMCEFSKDENVYIDDVLHKTFVEVNEEGTEAAAVTSISMGMATEAYRTKKTFRMVVDRPFFFAIRDNKTGAVLFMGSIVEPKIKE